MASGPKWNRQRKTWYVQYRQGGRWRRKTVADGPPSWREGDDEPAVPAEALAEFDRLSEVERQAREAEAAGLPSSLRRFFDDHLRRYAKDATRRSIRETVDQFLAFCDRRGVTECAQVDRRLCERWIEDLAGRYAINTVTRKRAQVAAAWGIRKKRGEIRDNPWIGVDPKGKATTKDRAAWTRAQFDLLHARAPAWLRDVLTLGVNTGLRIEAMIRLEWRDVIPPESPDQKHGFVRVRKELDKAGKGYKVPISRDLKGLLDRRGEDARRDPTFILTGARGAPIYNRNVTGTAIKRACARAGLAVPHSPNHHLRRSFGRWAVLGQLTGTPVPLYVVSRWMGHHSVKTTMIYLGMEEEDSARFMVPDDSHMTDGEKST